LRKRHAREEEHATQKQAPSQAGLHDWPPGSVLYGLVRGVHVTVVGVVRSIAVEHCTRGQTRNQSVIFSGAGTACEGRGCVLSVDLRCRVRTIGSYAGTHARVAAWTVRRRPRFLGEDREVCDQQGRCGERFGGAQGADTRRIPQRIGKTACA